MNLLSIYFCILSLNTLSGHAYLSPYIIMYNMTEISVMAAQRVNDQDILS